MKVCVHSLSHMHTHMHPCTGLVALMEVIKAATEIVLSSYSLKHQLSCSGMMQILSDIRHQVLTLAYAPHSPL